jgi:hypothetical protein
MESGPRDAADADRVAGTFRVEDPEVDVESLVATIREKLATRPPLGADVAPLLRLFGASGGPASAQDEVEYALEWLGLWLQTPLPSDRMKPATGPVGRALDVVRRQFHDVVRYYVDAQAERQEEVVRRLHAALRAIVASQSSVDTRYDALGDDAAVLRQRVDALERQVVELRTRLAEAEGAGHPGA